MRSRFESHQGGAVLPGLEQLVGHKLSLHLALAGGFDRNARASALRVEQWLAPYSSITTSSLILALPK